MFWEVVVETAAKWRAGRVDHTV